MQAVDWVGSPDPLGSWVLHNKGRRESHDLDLVKEVQEARMKFQEAEKAAWDKKMAEWNKE